MPQAIQREVMKATFRPLKRALDEVIASAREATTHQRIADANPDITREEHISRIRGLKRWILIADGLVARAGEFPEGFGILTHDSDHACGRYVFQFPGGVFTVRQHPHDEDEGVYLQERLNQVVEQVGLAEGVDPNAGITAYLAVPATRPARLVFTHPTLDKPMTILVDEIDGDDAPVRMPMQTSPKTVVRSTVTPAKGSEAPNER